MKFYTIKTPSIIQRVFSSYRWRFSSVPKEIYLTFDDGPTPEITTFVLNELKKHKLDSMSFSAEKLIESNLFRPPYGRLKSSQARSIIGKGYKIIMWDILSGDFDTTITPEKCLKNVLDKTTNGSIVVMHDSEKAKDKIFYTLPKILSYYQEKGYLFKAIS